MTTATMEGEVIGVGDLAARFGASRHCVRQVIARLEIGHKVGGVLAILSDDLPKLEMGLKAAGYTKSNRATARVA